MAIEIGQQKINPTEIKCINNGTTTYLTILKEGSTAVWGKPYNLNISVDSNVSITVNRISSPNQHAPNQSLSNGSTVYHGDVLTITANVSSGYILSSLTINGSNFTNGGNVTISSALNIVATSVQNVGWKTNWEGSLSCSISSQMIGMDTSTSMPTPLYGDPYILVSDSTVSSLLSSMESSKIRITGTMSYKSVTDYNTSSDTTQTYSTSFSQVLLNGTISGGGTIKLQGWGSRTGLYGTSEGILCSVVSSTSSGQDSFLGYYTNTKTPQSITITKIERYY